MDFFDELKRRLSNSLRFFYALFCELVIYFFQPMVYDNGIV